MARKRKQEEPTSEIGIKFFGDRVEVEIDGFENITPAKIQRSFDFVLKEWQEQQQRAIYERRRQERNDRQGQEGRPE